MEYQVGHIGRIVVACLAEGEDVYGEIETLAAKESLRCAAVVLLGGIRRARVVTGPKDPTGPIEPNFTEFDDAREIVGVGTIFPDESGLKLHFHAGIGRGEYAIVGCPRGGAKVFCVLEVVIFEINGLDAARMPDEKLGLKLLSLVRSRPCEQA